MRDKDWLEHRFIQIWDLFFPDIERKNVYVCFKGKWKNKFGHIKQKKDKTEIAINSLFSDIRVPENIVKVTLAHEIVHYMHGFFSHLPRKYKHPHKYGIVDKVLKKKGFGYMLRQEKEWFRNEWPKLYKELHTKIK